ncbi:MAG: hypothetical protein ACN4GF_04585 [Lentimonas sp.]
MSALLAAKSAWRELPQRQRSALQDAYTDVLELHYWSDQSLTDLTYTVVAFADLSSLTPTSFTDVLEGSANPTVVERWKATAPVDAPQKFM